MARMLANEYRAVYESRDPKRIFAYTPGICWLASGRLVTTMDQGWVSRNWPSRSLRVCGEGR